MFFHLRCESGELLLSMEYLPRMVMVMFVFTYHSLFYYLQFHMEFPWPPGTQDDPAAEQENGVQVPALPAL